MFITLCNILFLCLSFVALSVFYCYDGLLRERPFEVIGYAATVFILVSYVIINYWVEGEQQDVIKLVRDSILTNS